MKTKQIFCIISMLLVFSFVFSACSNNAATPNNSTTASQNSSTPDTVTPVSNADDSSKQNSEQYLLRKGKFSRSVSMP